MYFIADLYPWWGLPLAFIFAEVANRYRRRGERGRMLGSLLLSVIFLALAGAYFVFNGFENLRPAMEKLDRQMFTK